MLATSRGSFLPPAYRVKAGREDWNYPRLACIPPITRFRTCPTCRVINLLSVVKPNLQLILQGFQDHVLAVIYLTIATAR